MTLVELMVVIVILALVLTSVTTAFVQQQRFYSGTMAMVTTRTATRELGYLLPSELRGVSPSDSDIYAMGGSYIEYRSLLGASVTCTINPGRTTITIPPLSLASQAALTSWVSVPMGGDTVEILDPGVVGNPKDDVWRRYVLVGGPVAGGVCPTTTGFTTTVSEAASGWTLTVTPALTASTTVGASIRFVRRARYQLYQSAADNGWYLGFYDCPPAYGCRALQPVSGPYLAPGSGGLQFSYFDSTGAATADRTKITRIDIAARAQSQQQIRMAGHPGTFIDSVFFTVAPRN